MVPDQSRTPHFFLTGCEGSKSLQFVAAAALFLLLFSLGSHWYVRLGCPDDVSAHTQASHPQPSPWTRLPSPRVHDPWAVSHAFDFPDPPAAGQLLTEFQAALQLFQGDLIFQSYFLSPLFFPLSPITPGWHPPAHACCPSPLPLAPRRPSIGGRGPALSGQSCPSAWGRV